MKKLILTLALLTVSALFIQKSVAGNRQQTSFDTNNKFSETESQGDAPYMTRKFPAAAISTVNVSSSGGSIQLVGDADNDAVVEMYVAPSNMRLSKLSKEEIDKILLNNYVVEIKSENGQLTASAKRINRIGGNSLSISFKISVKQKTASKLLTSGGSISLNNLTGTQEFNTSGGSLRIENTTGKINGNTSGGSIHVSNSKEQITLNTSGGSITAEDCSGQLSLNTSGGSIRLTKLSGTVKANTSGGSIRLNELDGNIEARTSGGSVTADNVKGTLNARTSGGSMTLTAISGNLEATTSAGSMTVGMKAVNEYVRLKNSGNISLTLPAEKGYNLKIRAGRIDAVGGLNNFSGRFESRDVEGTIGNGGPEITVSSSQRARIAFE